MLSGKKRVFSMTSLLLIDHIAQAKIRKINFQGMSRKRDVEEEVAVARGIGREFGPDWLYRGAVSKSM